MSFDLLHNYYIVYLNRFRRGSNFVKLLFSGDIINVKFSLRKIMFPQKWLHHKKTAIVFDVFRQTWGYISTAGMVWVNINMLYVRLGAWITCRMHGQGRLFG